MRFFAKPTDTAVTNFATGPFNVGDAGNYFFGVTFTGANVIGTLTLEASSTPDFTNFWVVTGSSQAVASSANKYYDTTLCSYPYVRLRWAYTSGTGNITVEGTCREPYVHRG